MTAERAIIEGLLSIPNKQGIDVPFILNNAQRALDSELSSRAIVPKARQLGISTYFLALNLVRCLSYRNRCAVVIAHQTKATQRLLNRVHYMLNHLRGPKAVLKYSSRNEISFPKTDSVFYIGTAGSQDFGVGDTITDLHCSEIARWPNPEQLMSDLLQSVPDTGNIYIESTGKGVGNFYHRICMRSAQGSGDYKLHFFNWLWDPAYSLELSETDKEAFFASLDDSLEEPQLLKAGVSLEQLAWRRKKLSGPDFDYDLIAFKEQYPFTLDECFQSRAHSYFNRFNFVATEDWTKDPFEPAFHFLKPHPQPGSRYILGVDPSGGVGANNAVIQVVKEEDCEQVGEWASNVVEPDLLAQKVAEIGRRFNHAFVNVEKNNHGILVLSRLLDIYPQDKICRSASGATKPQRLQMGLLADYGITTNSATKSFMIGNMRHLLAEGAIFHSPFLKDELNTFREHPDGKLAAEGSCMDDRVMAYAVATYGMSYGTSSSEPLILWA